MSTVIRLFERWLLNHSDATYPDSDLVLPAQRAEAYMAPFFPLRTNNYYLGKDTLSLGYRYVEQLLHRAAAGSSTRQAAGYKLL